MAQKIFGVTDKKTGEVVRLFKAETRTQVTRHIMNSISVEPLDALDVAMLLTSKALPLEDVQSDDQGDTEESKVSAGSPAEDDSQA
jgi:hypothetical protein